MYYVHYDIYAMNPYGVWWVNSLGQPTCIYTDPESPQAARGKIVMYGKPEGTDWATWMRLLTMRSSQVEQWVSYDPMGMSPSEFLAALKPPPELPLSS